jgi:tetratricopeptide (TPR) repeat protein
MLGSVRGVPGNRHSYRDPLSIVKMIAKKVLIKIAKPFMWVLTQILGLIPGYGNIIKAINGERDVRKFEESGKYEEARKLRTDLLNRYPVKHLGPLWRSEGVDQLYNQENYEKALEAFEKAISCIEGNSLISAFQYGVTQPMQVYYGAAAAAIYVSNKMKAKVYYQNFLELVTRSSCIEQYQEQLNWLKNQIDDSKSQTGLVN